MRVTAVLGLLFLFTCSCSSTRGPARRSPAPIPTPEMLAAGHPPQTCRVTLWEDGDTPTVACAGSEEPVVIRMIGIDTAESGFDENSRKRARRQVDLWGMTLEQVYACGKAATRRVRKLCPVGSEVEVIGSERGKYGRLLAYVICKGVNLNRLLVEEGLAGSYPYPGPPEKPAACPLPSAQGHKADF